MTHKYPSQREKEEVKYSDKIFCFRNLRKKITSLSFTIGNNEKYNTTLLLIFWK